MIFNATTHIPQDTTPKRRPTSKRRDEVAHRENTDLHIEWSNEVNSDTPAPGKLRDIEANVLAANRGLMQNILGPFKRRGTPSEDLEQAAAMGFWQAWTKWDPSQGTLHNFASKYVLGEVRRAVRRDEYPEFNDTACQLLWKLRAKRAELVVAYQRDVGAIELHHTTGEMLNLCMTAVSSVASGYGDGFHRTALYHVEAECVDDTQAEIDADNEIGRQLLAEAYAAMTPIELMAITMRNGLAGDERSTLIEIGERIGVSRETVRRHEISGQRRLQAV